MSSLRTLDVGPAPELLQHVQRLDRGFGGALQVEAQRSELVGSVASAEPHLEPASGQLVSLGDLLSQSDRMMEWQDQHGRADPDTAGALPDGSRDQQRVGD